MPGLHPCGVYLFVTRNKQEKDSDASESPSVEPKSTDVKTDLPVDEETIGIKSAEKPPKEETKKPENNDKKQKPPDSE